jgi:Zn-dependent protease/CBS domain-containing protein
MANSTEDSTRPTFGLRLATIGGVPVYIGKSWPIIVLFIVATSAPAVAEGRPDLGWFGASAVALAYVVLLLVSVFAHEAAHAVVATRVGYRVNRVVADLWGGHTAYDSATERPGASALVAIAGPVANALLAVVGWLALHAAPFGVPYMLVYATAFTNAFVAVFNLLPGLPLDGGSLVDSLVWRVTGNRESGLIAGGWCGRAVAALVVLWFVGRPLLSGQSPNFFVVWVFLAGSFLWLGATSAIRRGHGSRLLAGIRIESVWRRAASVPARASAAQALALRISGPVGTAVIVEDDAGNAIGLLDDEALQAIPEQSLASVGVTAVMRQQPAGWVVEATGDQSIAPVVAAMQRFEIGAVPVRGPDGQIDGIVLAGDLEAALSRRPAPPA